MYKLNIVNSLNNSILSAFKIFVITVLGMVFSPSIVHAQSTSAFILSGSKLTVTTPMIQLDLKGGAVVSVKDLATTTQFSTSDCAAVPNFSEGFIPDTAAPTLQVISNTQAKLNYFIPNKGNLVINITVDTNGEVILQATGSGTGIPNRLDIPMLCLNQQSVILGSGNKVTRSEPTISDYATHSGFESPVMAVIESSNKVLAVWQESTTLLHNNIYLNHNQNTYDNLFLQTLQDEKTKTTTPNTIHSATWRIGIYNNWYTAAKRWKTRFETITGALPLWQNPALWVRKVHAMYWGTNNVNRLDTLITSLKSKNIQPSSVLNFLWNGDRIVLFGDHRLANEIGFPNTNTQNLMLTNSMPMILYHPWTLIWTKEDAAARISSLKSHTPTWLPLDWSPLDVNGFRPDYENSNLITNNSYDDWLSYWSDVTTCYFECPGINGAPSQLYLLHPGSTKFKKYLNQNLFNYNSKFQANGSYLDISGGDHGYLFPSSKFPNTPKVIEGQDYMLGESNAIAYFLKLYPNQGIMAEYAPQHLLGKVFYTWQGSETYASYYSNLRINHPLRVALTGSYLWTRDSNSKNTNETISNLLGGLPEYSMVGDYQVTDSVASYSQQRVKLFTDMELFFDIPDSWDEAALAYWRSKNGYWVKYKPYNDSYAYLEEIPGSADKVLLVQNGVYTPPSSVSPTIKLGDIDYDGDVDIFDYAKLVSEYGKTNSPADLNHNGVVDIYDYVTLISNFGR